MVQEPSTLPAQRLPAATRIGSARLAVADMPRSLSFYQAILGYQAEPIDGGLIALRAADGTINLVLHELPGAANPGRRATGLYHVAILLPSRVELALVVQRLAQAGWRIAGASDHGVSEAFYLDDPDGNGLELYADRPRELWPMRDSQVRMGSEPIDLDGLFARIGDRKWLGIPAGTSIGHMHLKVSDLAVSKQFYTEVLGFDVMQEMIPSALFVSAGGYHHHIGMNTWTSRGGQRPPTGTTGLERFEILLPEGFDLGVLAASLHLAGSTSTALCDQSLVVTDPDGIEIEFKAGQSQR